MIRRASGLLLVLGLMATCHRQEEPTVTVQIAGFKVDVLYTASREEGSWASMTFDSKGRVIVSPERGRLLRLTLPQDGAPIKVEKIAVSAVDAQGLLCANASLYVAGNGPAGCGLYRFKESGDGFVEEPMIKAWTGGMTEHGPHALLLGPDGRIYCIVGNHGKLPSGLADSSPHVNYQEDLLLPRMWDPNGHAVNIMAPGGYVVRTDADGKEWELICGGFRNQYDAAFSPEGELFTYDSDMEWDIGTPWYRPTRLYHCVSGGEYGWRSASGKWPAAYPDNLPMAADIGLGSPTGMVFGTKAKFPAKWQRALFALDWAYGRILAVHLKPEGASFTATFEPFVVGQPLNVTDVEIGPDGAMYFVTGGRGTPSRLYRVSYTGTESTAPAKIEEEAATVAARRLRHELESFHGKKDPQAVRVAWPHLNSPDRWIRFAARIAIERQDVALWKDRALQETLPAASLAALLALIRCGDKSLQPRVLEALNRLGVPWDKIGEDEKIDLFRCYQVCFTRMGRPSGEEAERVAQRLDAVYPERTGAQNRELCMLLLYLGHPRAIPKTLALLGKATTQEDQLHYAFHLRSIRDGWTMEQRRTYFAWFNDAEQKHKGGRSFQGFIRNSRDDALATLTSGERVALDPVIRAGFASPAPAKGVKPKVVKKWKMEDLLPDLEQPLRSRNFQSGQSAMLKARCLACHRCGVEGGATGPDLSAAASRFSRRDLLESILLPSKVISDQYQNTVFQRSDGDLVVGRMVKEESGKIFVRTDPLDDTLTVIARKEIVASKPSPISPMPEALVDVLTKTEILDLIAYIESAGNQGHADFKK
jgi:putative heme-binding domain-containing protein